MKPLTSAQRRALTILDAHGTARVAHPNQLEPPGRLDIPAQTARVLTQNGWAVWTCAADQRGLVATRSGFTDPGRLHPTPEGHRELHRPVPDVPVFFTDSGSLKYRLKDGRWIVDDGVSAEARGTSLARTQETEAGSLEARGLTTNPGRRSRTSGDAERQDPADLGEHWAEEAAVRKAAAEGRREQARRLARGTRRAA